MKHSIRTCNIPVLSVGQAWLAHDIDTDSGDEYVVIPWENLVTVRKRYFTPLPQVTEH